MMDVKKLVTGFLVLAVATSASAFLISTIGDNLAKAGTSADNTSGVAIVAGTAAAGAQAGTTLTGNAFLPQVAAADPGNDATTTDAIMEDPNNLTNVLTNAYMNNLVSANPNGANTDANGNPILTQPDNNGVIAQFVSSSTALANLQTPDWTNEANQVPITVIATSSPNAVTNYSAAVQDILNRNFVQTNLQSMLSNNSDPSAVGYIEPKIQTALRDVAGLQTPAPLKAFQKSLVKLLVYEKNVVSLTGSISSSSDPLKIALVLQNETPKYNAAVQDFQNESQKAAALTGFTPLAANKTGASTNGVVAFVNAALGIPTAHAQWITFDPTTFAQMLIDYANNIVLQILKNLITSLMQKTVLKWVQGAGVPRFIQNWGTTLVNAYTNAAINTLNSQFACVNPAYRSQLQILLKIPTPTAPSGVCAVQFSNALAGGNLTNFYNNFSSGGFVSYMAIFQPSGNLFGSAIDAQDAAMNAGLQNYASVQTKSISNQGWNGGQTCDDNSNPSSGTHFVCPDGSKPSVAGLCFVVGQQPYPASVSPNGGLCADGTEPQVTQPGQVTGQVFNSAVDSSAKVTAAANDIAGLLDSFLSSLLNSLATEAITAGSGVLNNLGSGGGGGGSANNQAGQIPISCTGGPQPNAPDTVTFIGAGGQTISVTNNQSNTSVPSYTWSIPGGTPAAGAGGQFITTFASGGTYVATITDTNPTDGGVSAQCSVTVP